MKRIDNTGLILCDLQAELFEKSLILECSSEIFIRRFMNSKIVKSFDTEQILDDTIMDSNIFEAINDEYGKSKYGTNKYSKNELYWIGHIYRYLCYTYEISSKYAYKLIKPKELRSLFIAYHTLDSAHAIERILEAKNINLNIDYTQKGLEILRRMHGINTHYIKINNQSFIDNNLVIIDSNYSLKVNDIIIFEDLANNKYKTKVLNLYQYNNLNELYKKYDKLSFYCSLNNKDCGYHYLNEDEKVLAVKVKII